MCRSCLANMIKSGADVIEHDYRDEEERNPMFSTFVGCPICKTSMSTRGLQRVLDKEDGRVGYSNRVVREEGGEDDDGDGEVRRIEAGKGELVEDFRRMRDPDPERTKADEMLARRISEEPDPVQRPQALDEETERLIRELEDERRREEEALEKMQREQEEASERFIRELTESSGGDEKISVKPTEPPRPRTPLGDLQDMGFEGNSAEQALQRAGGDVNLAVGILMGDR